MSAARGTPASAARVDAKLERLEKEVPDPRQRGEIHRAAEDRAVSMVGTISGPDGSKIDIDRSRLQVPARFRTDDSPSRSAPASPAQLGGKADEVVIERPSDRGSAPSAAATDRARGDADGDRAGAR